MLQKRPAAERFNSLKNLQAVFPPEKRACAMTKKEAAVQSAATIPHFERGIKYFGRITDAGENAPRANPIRR